MSGSGKKSAFTLIELLIVVAIIAILAAIAVPNFLEAQTRSKTARVKADQRTVATAIEAYSVDERRCPLYNNEKSLIYGIPSECRHARTGSAHHARSLCQQHSGDLTKSVDLGRYDKKESTAISGK